MKRVYSRWPTGFDQLDRPLGLADADGGLPFWANAGEQSVERDQTPFSVAVLNVSPLLLSITVLLLAIPFAPHASGIWISIVVCGAVFAGLAWSIRLWQQTVSRQRLQASETMYGNIFERAGISIWLEDWTAAAKAIVELRRSGVRDIKGYYTSNPDAARRLRKKILVKDVNAFTVEMMGASGKSDFVGPLDRILPDTDQTFLQWIVAFERGDRFYRSETHIIRPDGSTMDCLFTAALPADMQGFDKILVSCFDITDYKTDQERLVAAETEIARVARVSTIGALTASIAHEVNSPLAAIISSADACQRWLARPVPDIVEAQAAAASVIEAALNAREVVHRTRSYLTRSPAVVSPMDLVAAVRDASLLVDKELRDLGVSLHFDADDDLPPVMADRIGIQQVVVNLLLNGAQAMSDLSGPRDITVTVERENDTLRVDVTDRGRGFQKETESRMFDPFYSTRSDGLGMGLAICKNAVEAHGGRIWAENVQPRGAMFRFSLPIASV